MKDILIFLSDQHSGSKLGCMGDDIVRTPNLDRIGEMGVVFRNAYTSCPLCVPARMSMLTGRLPSTINQFNNFGSIHPDQPTFLHAMTVAGYETVLCGRMHFDGLDQRHGFTKRIAGDITPTAIRSHVEFRKKRKSFALTLGDIGCITLIGGGNSPTLAYDRYVIDCALEYLNESHEKPQIIVVGTYAPHFPYVAPKELYDYYFDKVTIPETALETFDSVHPVHAKRMIDKSENVVRAARAAYYGMVEFTDQKVGEVHAAWQEYLSRTNREGIFVYLSDHGDHAGDRGFYGKQSLYEESVHIPLIVEGGGLQSGVTIESPVSIMDIGPTLCDLAEAPQVPEIDGKSLKAQLLNGIRDEGRIIIAEWINSAYGPEYKYGRMLRTADWKFITYADYPEADELFAINDDLGELTSLTTENKKVANELKELAYEGVDVARIVHDCMLKDENYKLIQAWGTTVELPYTECWYAPEEALAVPEDYVSTEVSLPGAMRKFLESAESEQ